MQVDNIETSIGTIMMRPDGIVMMDLRDNMKIEIVEISEFYNALAKLTGGKRCLLLVQTGQGSTSSREAREFAANYRKKGIIAQAVIANNLAHKLLANFYLRFHKPSQPMQIFSTEEEGLHWLQKFNN